ncbi:T9SS type A sorting domain-containing protein [Fluviicola sp.]|uniref:T9SS type A sorting domain-containing protein n=1 Tax=Fluviicola sp. TaxID=1917219 RepID=UPI0031E2D388
MKKILLSLGVAFSALSVSAQTVVNPGFESTMAPISGFQYVYATTGWTGINFGPETASPYQGSQAAKLVTTNDPALNTALSWGDDVIPGIIQQRVNGPVANPADLVVSMAVKFTKMGTDTAYIEVGIMDTMAAGSSDDVLLYAAALEISSSVSNWTPANFQMTNLGATGTPNRFYILAVSSTTGYFDTNTPTAGTTLWIDAVKTGSLGLNDAELSSAISVYPNPATTVLNIQSQEAISAVSILTTDGKVVATGDSSSINVEALNAGMYIYRITTISGKMETGNFVKN